MPPPGSWRRWIGNRTIGRGSLLVLTYHRVLVRRDPLLPGEVCVDDFAAQMAFVHRYLTPMPLLDAVHALARNKLPAGAVAVTFDDGYANNATQALPVLQRYGVPATIFVAVDLLDGGLMFNDALVELVRGVGAEYLDTGDLGLGALPVRSTPERAAAVVKLVTHMKYLAPASRLPMAEALARSLRVELPRDLMLTSAQLCALDRSGIDIGGHTRSHPILSGLGIGAARDEINGSYAFLEKLLGRPPRAFAYPNGVPGRDFTPEHVEMVRQAGYVVAVTTERRLAQSSDDALMIPRATLWRSDTLGLFRNLLSIRVASG